VHLDGLGALGQGQHQLPVPDVEQYEDPRFSRTGLGEVGAVARARAHRHRELSEATGKRLLESASKLKERQARRVHRPWILADLTRLHKRR
jgi:hypothetical protein